MELNAKGLFLCFRTGHIRVRPSAVRDGLPQHRVPGVRRRGGALPGQLRGPGHPGPAAAAAHEPPAVLRGSEGTRCKIYELGLPAVPGDAGAAAAARLHGAGRGAAGRARVHGGAHRGRAHCHRGAAVGRAGLPALRGPRRAALPAGPAPRAPRAALPRALSAPPAAPPVLAEHLQTLQTLGC